MMRHVSISTDPVVAAEQNAENARDANDVFETMLKADVYVVEPYIAVGSTSAKIPLRSSGSRPSGVVPINVINLDSPGTLVSMPTYSPAFVYDAARDRLDVFEPDGLTAASRYRITFLVVR